MNDKILDPTPSRQEPPLRKEPILHHRTRIIGPYASWFAPQFPAPEGIYQFDDGKTIGGQYGTSIGPRLGPLKISGDGIYVVDSPLAGRWNRIRLLLNSQDAWQLTPGMVIPERYNELDLAGLCRTVTIATATDPPVIHPQAPIVLAVGPRGNEYRQPGMRVHHLWPNRSFGDYSAGVATNTVSPFSKWIEFDEYDLVVGVMMPTDAAAITEGWKVHLEFADPLTNYQNTGLPDEQHFAAPPSWAITTSYRTVTEIPVTAMVDGAVPRATPAFCFGRALWGRMTNQDVATAVNVGWKIPQVIAADFTAGYVNYATPLSLPGFPLFRFALENDGIGVTRSIAVICHFYKWID